MPKCLDESRTSVTRKGVEKPILVDLTQKDARPFRLVDGDVIDFVLQESVRKEMEENKLALSLGWSLASANYLDATGLLATCLQHEIDHLNGVLFIDHISKLKRDRVIKKFQKAAKLGKL